MSQVDFNEENEFKFKSRAILGSYEKPGLAGWMQKKGVVKSDKAALNVMVAIIVVCVGLAGMIIFRDSIFGGNSEPRELTPAELQQLPPGLKEAALESQNR